MLPSISSFYLQISQTSHRSPDWTKIFLLQKNSLLPRRNPKFLSVFCELEFRLVLVATFLMTEQQKRRSRRWIFQFDMQPFLYGCRMRLQIFHPLWYRFAAFFWFVFRAESFVKVLFDWFLLNGLEFSKEIWLKNIRSKSFVFKSVLYTHKKNETLPAVLTRKDSERWEKLKKNDPVQNMTPLPHARTTDWSQCSVQGSGCTRTIFLYSPLDFSVQGPPNCFRCDSDIR